MNAEAPIAFQVKIASNNSGYDVSEGLSIVGVLCENGRAAPDRFNSSSKGQ